MRQIPCSALWFPSLPADAVRCLGLGYATIRPRAASCLVGLVAALRMLPGVTASPKRHTGRGEPDSTPAPARSHAVQTILCGYPEPI